MSVVSQALYPFKSNFFDRGAGLQMHYLDEGKGAPVLMVHGNPSWSFYYRNLVNALSATQRCIVPDHIGMGLSDKPDDANYTYTSLANRTTLSTGQTMDSTLNPSSVSLAVGYRY